MTHYSLSLLGFGNVGRAFARLLLRKQAELSRDYGITFSVTGIATGRHGMALDSAGLDLEQALARVEAGQDLAHLSTQPAPADIPAFIQACGAQVLFETTPVNYETGQPALGYLHLALELGMHAVTANKGPVVHGYRQLTDLAAQHGRQFFFESSVMDGAPIFSLFRGALPGARLLAFSGILNSTTNLILGRMEGGESFDDAVAYAQSIGIAETDPSGDVDGWDAAVKVAALVTVLMGFPFKPQQVKRQGIRSLSPQDIAAARQQGKRWKLVCNARREGDGIEAQVSPQMVGPDSPLFSVGGTSSVVQFETDVLSSLSVVEGNPGPETTAYGLLADFLNAVRTQ
ncbi:MAG TPA: homoserine dehydrogenase [Anaerolineales bacterium]|nr:homoserine dehydrogenase [Anaerolineales bacterium]